MTLMQRRRALMGAKSGELPILNPSVGFTEDTALSRAGTTPPYLVAKTGVAVTDFIDAGTTGNFVYFNPPDTGVAPNGTCLHLMVFSTADDAAKYSDWRNCVMAGVEKSVGLNSSVRYVRLNLSMGKMSGAYAYNSSTGQVYYAGKDSPYYGKSNIND